MKIWNLSYQNLKKVVELEACPLKDEKSPWAITATNSSGQKFFYKETFSSQEEAQKFLDQLTTPHLLPKEDWALLP
jgi:hypothetical protein